MNNTIKSLLLITNFSIGSLFSFNAVSAQVNQAPLNQQQISQEQIEQFRSLPKAQQEALAKSMGIDLNTMMGQASNYGEQNLDEQRLEHPIFREVNPIIEGDEELSDDKQDKKLKAFGYDVFANEPTSFAPRIDIAVPDDYILGSGDVVSVQVFGKQNLNFKLPVTREGLVVLPRLGPYRVAGLTITELKLFLSNAIKERIIGVEAVISLASLRSMRVFVLGDVYKPGPYTLSSLSSMTHAVFAAGGISDIGSLRNIQLKRAGKLVSKLDLYDLLINGDSSGDALLKPGDVVFVASVGQVVKIDGQVRRPAIYELAKGDSFADILAMSGGLLPSAYAKSTIVERYSQNRLRTIVNIDLDDDSQLASIVNAGDFVHVGKISDNFKLSINLIGAVSRPGNYQWQQGQKISDLLPDIDSHLLEDTDLTYSIITREIDLARNIEVLQFRLANILTDINSDDNLILQPRDKIIIFSSVETKEEEEESSESPDYSDKAINKIKNTTLDNILRNNEPIDTVDVGTNSRQRLLAPIILKLKNQSAAGTPIKLVEVDGEVKFSGIYPLPVNGRVSDLVSAAGGVKESAYLAAAEITRNNIEGIESRKISKNIHLLNALKYDPQDNILLQSKDRLNIHKIPSWSKNRVVELKGEFVFPGRYIIRRGDTLSDVIKKAGGLTQYAHPEGSVFSRVRLKAMEQDNIRKLTNDLRVEMASKSITDSSLMASYSQAENLLEDLSKLDPMGRLVIDLPRIVAKNDYDVLLETGDVLFVPMKKNSINVIGQVQVTSSHMFDNQFSVQDYIGKSGGIKIRADEDRIYIISANGNIKTLGSNNWFSENSSKLAAGDTIVVPLDTEYMDNLTLWSTATQIIYNSAVAIAAISGI